jgi:hypothetical protein
MSQLPVREVFHLRQSFRAKSSHQAKDVNSNSKENVRGTIKIREELRESDSIEFEQSRNENPQLCLAKTHESLNNHNESGKSSPVNALMHSKDTVTTG